MRKINLHKLNKIAALLLVTGLTAAAPLAQADEHRWHGDMRNFHVHDFPHWREGHWYHGGHDGRLGWWWVAAGMWYFYPAPVYPYPDPYEPPVVMEQAPTEPPSPQYWFYCESARTYYPYTAACPEGWKKVPAQPAPH